MTPAPHAAAAGPALLDAPLPSGAAFAATARLTVEQTATWITGHWPQVAAGVVAGGVLVAVLVGIRWVGVRLCGRDALGLHWRGILGRVLAHTRTPFMIALAAELVADIAAAPPAVRRVIHVFFIVAMVIQATAWLRELILGLVERRAGPESDQSTLGGAMGIIRLLVNAALFAVATIVILDNLGVNVTGLVAGLGIGGIAIGLAAQGIVADLFAALSILFDKPFRRGDTVRWDQTTGRVETIGLKTTRLRAVDRRGGRDLQRQPAEQGAAQPRAARPAAGDADLRRDLPDTAGGRSRASRRSSAASSSGWSDAPWSMSG